MRRLAVLAVAVAVAAAAPEAAHAAPRKSSLSPADRKKYKALLKTARQLQNKHDYARAITALEDCLKVAPDDATVLGELGFTLFEAKRLDEAEATTRKAIHIQAAPNVRGATLYNLGLIREARNDTPGAIAAYGESLKVRPNQTVRARLTALDPRAAAQIVPYALTPLAAFASVKAFCASNKVEPDEDGYDCSCGEPMDAPPIKLAAPYRGVQLFAHDCHLSHVGSATYYVGVSTAKGLFIGKLRDGGFDRNCDNAMAFKDAHVQDDKLLVGYVVDGSCTDDDESYREWQTTAVVIIGGTTPAMTPELVTHRTETEGEGGKPKVTVDLALRWGSDGSLEVKGKSTGLDGAEAARVLGKHALVFP